VGKIGVGSRRKFAASPRGDRSDSVILSKGAETQGRDAMKRRRTGRNRPEASRRRQLASIVTYDERYRTARSRC
jgi:hypothetical protein